MTASSHATNHAVTAAMSADLDAFLDEANSLVHTDYKAFMDFCNSKSFKPVVPLPDDPFSPEYRAAVAKNHEIYASIDAYKPAEHESARLDTTGMAVADQFPFSSGDPATVGRYIAGIGFLLSNMGLPKGSTVVEFGCGWGHLALIMARAGLRVRCVDIEPTFVQLINTGAEKEKLDVVAQVGNFGVWPVDAQGADGVVFFEAFHHALDHLKVCGQVRDGLKPGGKLFLCGEAVYPTFEWPWGLRLDGHAVWAIRSFKWMELGFNEAYLIKLLNRCGLIAGRIINEGIGSLGHIYTGQRPDGDFSARASLRTEDETASFHPALEPDLLFCRSRSFLSIADLSSVKTVSVRLRNFLPRALNVVIGHGPARREVCCNENCEYEVDLPITPGAGHLVLESDTYRPVDLGVNDDARELGVALMSLRYT